jgi:hypothetical protein
MDNIVITPKIFRNEFNVWLGLFALAIALNASAILYYQTEWIELFTQMGYVLAISIVGYLFVALPRFTVWLLKRRFRSTSYRR